MGYRGKGRGRQGRVVGPTYTGTGRQERHGKGRVVVEPNPIQLQHMGQEKKVGMHRNGRVQPCWEGGWQVTMQAKGRGRAGKGQKGMVHGSVQAGGRQHRKAGRTNPTCGRTRTHNHTYPQCR